MVRYWRMEDATDAVLDALSPKVESLSSSSPVAYEREVQMVSRSTSPCAGSIANQSFNSVSLSDSPVPNAVGNEAGGSRALRARKKGTPTSSGSGWLVQCSGGCSLLTVVAGFELSAAGLVASAMVKSNLGLSYNPNWKSTGSFVVWFLTGSENSARELK